MPYILRPWDRQPPPITKLNRSNPLGGALDLAWLPNDRNPFDVQRGLRLTGSAAAVAVVPKNGKLSWAGSTAGGTNLAYTFKNQYPFVAVAYGVFVVNNGWELFGCTGASSNLSLTTNSSSQVELLIRRNGGTTRFLTLTSPTFPAGTPVCIAIQVFSDTDYRLYANGYQVNGSLSFGTLGTWLNAIKPIASTLSGNLFFAGFGEGTSVPDDYLRYLTANPESELWKAFESRRIFIPDAPAASGGTTVAIPAGALSLTGQIPTVVTTANQTIAVPAGALALNGQTPTVLTPQTIAVPAGALSLTGLAPTVFADASQYIQVPAGALSLTGQTPTVVATANQTITVPAGALSLTGQIPTVVASNNKTIAVPAGALSLTALLPSVLTGANQTIVVPTGALSLSPYAPSIVVVNSSGTNCTEINLSSSGAGSCAFTGRAMPNNSENLSTAGAGYAS